MAVEKVSIEGFFDYPYDVVTEMVIGKQEGANNGREGKQISPVGILADMFIAARHDGLRTIDDQLGGMQERRTLEQLYQIIEWRLSLEARNSFVLNHAAVALGTSLKVMEAGLQYGNISVALLEATYNEQGITGTAIPKLELPGIQNTSFPNWKQTLAVTRGDKTLGFLFYPDHTPPAIYTLFNQTKTYIGFPTVFEAYQAIASSVIPAMNGRRQV